MKKVLLSLLFIASVSMQAARNNNEINLFKWFCYWGITTKVNVPNVLGIVKDSNMTEKAKNVTTVIGLASGILASEGIAKLVSYSTHQMLAPEFLKGGAGLPGAAIYYGGYAASQLCALPFRAMALVAMPFMVANIAKNYSNNSLNQTVTQTDGSKITNV